jgi:very-short-patch-repair endonuclease
MPAKGGVPWNKNKVGVQSNNHKGKKYNEIYGKEKTEMINNKIRNSLENYRKTNPNWRNIIIEASKGRKHTAQSKELMRKKAFEYVKLKCKACSPRIGHNEKQILDNCEKVLGYTVLRQYEVSGYFLDGYVPELFIAIEIDERPKDKEKDIERQKIIENKLGCKFIRINDFD